MGRWGWLVPVALAVLLAGCDVGNHESSGGGGGGAGSSGTAPGKPAGKKVGMVTDVGGIGDLSFNMMAWDGLQRAQKEVGIDPVLVESRQTADYESNLERIAGRGCSAVFAVGFALEPAVRKVAPQFPDTQFIIIDYGDLKAPNVTGIVFREEEGSYLVGALAGGMTKKGSLGFVGGMEIPLIKRFEAGYRAGIKTTNPNATVTAKYTNNWEEVDKGKELALALFDQGSDIVFHASGRCGLGVIEAARQKGPGFWAIGVDADQDYLGCADTQNPQPPSRVLTSMMKRVDNAVVTVCKELTDGSFKPGTREFGVKEDGVGITPLKFTKADIPDNLLKEVERLRGLVAEGKVKPPRTMEELDGWKAPGSQL